MNKLPLLLAPAGDPEALSAAISGGADAVYFGASAYNARMGARNFGDTEIKDAVAKLHAHGVRAHAALNIQLFDRELDGALRAAEALYLSGVDALIVADLGLARLLHKYFPELELHASTQCSGASVRDAEYFASLGFSCMVCARELSLSDIRTLAERSPIDIEMFVHGAICVSVSGQCLFSSLVGGRSGNRGECAQPCRLPYNGAYPLSPKDMCLAGHMREIIDSGVSSLKIEGRMKSADYVYRVTSLYRRLLDERRDADAGEIKAISSAFSRSGFTDAYFTGAVKKKPNEMCGIRTEEDKEKSRATRADVPAPSPVPVSRVEVRIMAGEQSRLSLTVHGRTVTVFGDVPESARTRPLTADEVRERVTKLGGTEYTATDETEFDITVGDGVMMTAAAINELRRRGIAALSDVTGRKGRLPEKAVPVRERAAVGKLTKTAEFLHSSEISLQSREFFDMIYVPLREYDGRADGFVMPAVVYDSEEAEVCRMAERAVSLGARAAILSGAGQLKLLGGAPLHITAGYRYNVCNTESALAALDAGADVVTVSPEATARQMKDIAAHVPTAAIVYGRVPLMVTERCIIRALSGDKCICGDGGVTLTDRRGVSFPIVGDGCRNVIYNSVPIYMADRKSVLSETGLHSYHFIFTTENKDEVGRVIENYMRGAEADAPIRRIK